VLFYSDFFFFFSSFSFSYSFFLLRGSPRSLSPQPSDLSTFSTPLPMAPFVFFYPALTLMRPLLWYAAPPFLPSHVLALLPPPPPPAHSRALFSSIGHNLAPALHATLFMWRLSVFLATPWSYSPSRSLSCCPLYPPPPPVWAHTLNLFLSFDRP